MLSWLLKGLLIEHETLYQTVFIIDSYLSAFPILRGKLQFLGVAGLFISCKQQEIYYPQIYELVDITDGAYVKEELD